MIANDAHLNVTYSIVGAPCFVSWFCFLRWAGKYTRLCPSFSVTRRLYPLVDTYTPKSCVHRAFVCLTLITLNSIYIYMYSQARLKPVCTTFARLHALSLSLILCLGVDALPWRLPYLQNFNKLNPNTIESFRFSCELCARFTRLHARSLGSPAWRRRR